VALLYSVAAPAALAAAGAACRLRVAQPPFSKSRAHARETQLVFPAC
jgi:hypothetical protein